MMTAMLFVHGFQIMNSEAFMALEAVLVVLADLGIQVLTHPVLPILPVQTVVEDVLEVEVHLDNEHTGKSY